MGWLLSRQRYGACLALAALALQIFLSFGHVHLDGVVRGTHTAPVVAAGAYGKSVLPPSRQAPAQNPIDDADGYCAICASIYLAATTFIPQPPRLPVPRGFECVEHIFRAVVAVVEPRRIAFQSRAPPAV
jgi:hypothetical protein